MLYRIPGGPPLFHLTWPGCAGPGLSRFLWLDWETGNVQTVDPVKPCLTYRHLGADRFEQVSTAGWPVVEVENITWGEGQFRLDKSARVRLSATRDGQPAGMLTVTLGRRGESRTWSGRPHSLTGGSPA